MPHPSGTYQPAQPAQPAADPRRDPFAATEGALSNRPQATNALPTDAGPLLDLPEPKKNRAPLIVGGLVLLAIGLGAGYAAGGISHARRLFNRTIDDAKEIEKSINELAGVEERITNALKESRARTKKKPGLDKELIDKLKAIQEDSALADPQQAKAVENKLFRSNYAMMEDVLINRLFNYYNDTLRLLTAVREFVSYAERRAEVIDKYVSEGGAAQGKYGVVAVDRGNYFEGRIVEVGLPICADKKASKAGKCKLDELNGFEVRAVGATKWTNRPSRARGKANMAGLVVPIAPDSAWQSVASAKPGYHAYREYLLRYRVMVGISGLLRRNREPLLKDLSKQAKRTKLSGS